MRHPISCSLSTCTTPQEGVGYQTPWAFAECSHAYIVVPKLFPVYDVCLYEAITSIFIETKEKFTTLHHCCAGSKHWFPLMRRSAGESVSGSIRLSFAWDVTARSLLNLKLAALERVLAQRTEVLCMLNPTSADTALKWAQEDSQQLQLAHTETKEKASLALNLC